MASRKKTPKPDAELLPDDAVIETPSKPLKEVTEVKTVKYIQPEDEQPDEDQFEYDERPKRKKKTEKELRSALRERLAQKGVTPISQLRVHIFRFEHDNDSISGVQAEKAFCAKIFTSEDGITNGQHLDAAQKFGPGRYLFMVYMNNAIVTSFEERISAPLLGQPMPVGQVVSEQNPAMIFQPGVAPVDSFAEINKTLKLVASIRQAFGQDAIATNPAPPPVSPELSVAEMLMKDPAHAKQIAKNLLGGEAGEERTWIDLGITLINNFPAMLQAAKDIFIAGGNQNGQAPHQPPQFQNHESQVPQTIGGNGANLPGLHTQGSGLGGANQSIPQSGQPAMPAEIPPEVQLLNMAVGMFMERWPADTAAATIQEYAKQNDAVKPFIDGFMEMPPTIALSWIKSQATGNQPVLQALNSPAAEKWIEALQDYLRPEDEGGETDEG